MLTATDAATFERCMAVGGIALFPADTVYGFACDARNREAVERMYRLKRRPLAKPSAVMLFDVELALAAVPEAGERTHAAMQRLLPGGVTLLLANPERRFPLACGEDPETLGLRVPALPPGAAALHDVKWPILQSSANRAGEPDSRAVDEVPAGLREAVDLVLDAGPLPGTPSTVIDLRRFDTHGEWTIVREGAVPAADVAAALARP
jgi:L-threonylcarbamoyladenylate synthase